MVEKMKKTYISPQMQLIDLMHEHHVMQVAGSMNDVLPPGTGDGEIDAEDVKGTYFEISGSKVWDEEW